jgi:uncharacterized hydantoinase/oxoprolinase family protein
MFIGIDIGGANTKVATSDGGFVDSIYAPLWKNNTILHDLVLSELKRKFEPGIEAVGVVMTGELCDCFATKREGVLHIKSAVSDTFKNAFRETKIRRTNLFGYLKNQCCHTAEKSQCGRGRRRRGMQDFFRVVCYNC